jgi:hypothetical protein
VTTITASLVQRRYPVFTPGEIREFAIQRGRNKKITFCYGFLDIP